MSVRSYTNSGNSLPAGGAIVTSDADGVATLEGILCGVAPDRGTGTAGEVLTAKGDGTMSWQTGGGGGTPTTLAIAMQNGNVASQDLYMAGYDISSEDALEISTAVGDITLNSSEDVRIGAQGVVELSCPGGLKVGTAPSVGAAGSVLLSMGAGADPEWTVPGIPPAMDDLNMNGFDIIQCGDINATAAMAITSSATTLNGPVSFGTEYPLVDSQVIAAGGPPVDGSLTTKKYVDDTIAGVAGVSPAGNNTWTGSNDFSDSNTLLGGGAAGTTIINTNAGLPGYGVSLIDTSQTFTRNQETTNAVMTPTHPNYYVMAYMTASGAYILLPGNTAAYDGCRITVMNCAFTLEIRAANSDGTGRMRNFSGNHNSTPQPWTDHYARCYLESGHSVEFVCMTVEPGDYYWCVITTSDTGIAFSSNL